MHELDKYKVPLSFSIRMAVKHMDEGGIGFCVCVDSRDVVVGIISDGDFRRSVLEGCKLDESVERILNKDFVSVSKDYDRRKLEDVFEHKMVQHIPVINEGILVEIITKEDLLWVDKNTERASLGNPVVIMAGGKGTRLDPFTRILPKPLIPLGDDPVIKVIMDGFRRFGMDNFFITLNDKGRMIKAYFSDHELDYRITYVEEDKPLGTAGALRYSKGTFDVPFFVSNCDIIVKTDYKALRDFHEEGSYDMTLVGSMQHYTIPYGVCEINNGGMLAKILEKPEYDYLVNTGLYFLNPEILDSIPENTYFDMPDLISAVQAHGLKVGVFPVSAKSWIDVGQWGEYKKAVKYFST